MHRLGTSEVQSDPVEYRKAAKALSDMEPLVQKYREYKAVDQDITGSEELARGSDAEMRALAEEELKSLYTRRDALLEEIKILLIPKDPNDEKNVILEIRAGTGGEEAALFASELFNMYQRYGQRQGWKFDVMSVSHGDAGGLKEAIASIEGRGVYSHLKFESGVHRVQRVPATEGVGADPHVHGHSRGSSGSGRRGHSDQREGPPHRHVLLERPGRSEREHDLFRRPADAHSRPVSSSRSRTRNRRSRTAQRR